MLPDAVGYAERPDSGLRAGFVIRLELCDTSNANVSAQNGSHVLTFTVQGDPIVHAAPFTLG
jgi:hypothetical protein